MGRMRPSSPSHAPGRARSGSTVALAALLLFGCRSPSQSDPSPPGARIIEAPPVDAGATTIATTAEPIDTGATIARQPLPRPPPILPSAERLRAPFAGTAAAGFVAMTVATASGGASHLIAPIGASGEALDDRPVAVASFTKLWTAIAALRFVERGELSLEDTIRDRLPELVRRPWADSSLRELLTHTSRVPEFDERGGYYGRPDVDFTRPVETLAAHVPRDVVEKRGVFKYRNAEFAIVGAILSRRAGLPIADVLAREVFEPAGMTRSGLLVGRPPPDLDLSPLGRARIQNFSTAGAGYASPRDLLSFFDALSGTALLSEEAKATLFAGSAERKQGALGCWAYPFAREDAGATALVERPGSLGDVRLFSAYFPEARRGLVAWSRTPVPIERPTVKKGIGARLARLALDGPE